MNTSRPRSLAGFALSGALALLLVLALANSAFAAEKFEVKSAGVLLSTTQAGAHADLTTEFELTSKENTPLGLLRDADFHLPPGVIGNPQAIPRCSILLFGGSTGEPCPVNTQVGIVEVTLGGDTPGTFKEPLYNLEPPKEGDIVARFGFYAAVYPAIVNIRIDPHDYSLIASVEGASAAAGVISAKTTIWGVPADPTHDEDRITPKEALEGGGGPPGGRSSGLPEVPFISNPTDCSLQRQLTVTARSYEEPSVTSSKTVPYPQITGCGKLGFNPTFSLIPTNPEASAPTGVEADLEIPQDETAKGLASSTLKSAVVSLPQGMTINSAAGDGLAACGAEEVHFEENVPAQCPEAAKLGSAEIDVPALEHVLHGAVYQRTPQPGHLFRFWLVSDELGAHLKLPAEIATNPLTGQVTTLFLGIQSLGGNPQVPVREIKLHIPNGPRAPLATPPACGTYQSHYEFAPWSGRAPVVGDTPMQITSGCNKGGLFSPGLEAGTTILRAGAFSPFTMTLTRSDGEAKPETLQVHLPQGLLAKLGGVPLCGDADAAMANCPAASQIGTIAAASGVGPLPLWIPQPGKAPTAIYLAGPYKGAPYSIVAKVPAQAGPFDLGTIVNRAGIYVDPTTALATVKTDPLPQILEGVPILYRAIHVDVDRPEFTLNPTSCTEKQITATVQATNGAVASPSTPFQATNCARLAYTPHLKMRFKGSTKRSGNPAVSATLTQPPHQADTAAATVILPSSEFIDQSHINNPCTRVQFNANECPASSILGHATALSPLLDQPLSGPIYFRSNGGERELPDIVADLNGPIHITLVGFIDSVQKKGTEVSRVRVRFQNVPDAPVTRFTTSFFGGRKGLIENHVPLCAKKRRVTLHFSAQNGRRSDTEPAIAIAGCGKK
jgi:hypothetical protein